MNELDTIKILYNDINFKKPTIYAKHCAFCKTDKGIIITVSSKFLSQENSLDGICAKNYLVLIAKINETFKIKLETEYFLNATVLRADVKKDVLLNTNISNYISSIREAISHKTTRLEVNVYGAKLGAENSLRVTSAYKNKSFAFNIYAKVKEIRDNKRADEDYFKKFSQNFLILNQNLMRIELQLKTFKEIRKAFNIDHKGAVTVSEILLSSSDVVKTYFEELLK